MAGSPRPLAIPARAAIAFSGGLDSRYLCLLALRAGADTLALHATGPHILPRETEGARAFARSLGLRLVVFDIDPLAVPEVAVTSRRRCYACKKALIARIRALLATLGEEDRTLCDGTNADDTGVYRPGLRALEEEGVRSPLAAAGLTKAMIRAGALEAGMPMPEGGSRPCLLTRYAYGLAPSREELARLADAESELLDLRAGAGCRDFRVRLTPAPVLQTARADPAWLEAAGRILARHGFAPFTVLSGDRVSGFYDRPADPGEAARKNP